MGSMGNSSGNPIISINAPGTMETTMAGEEEEKKKVIFEPKTTSDET